MASADVEPQPVEAVAQAGEVNGEAVAAPKPILPPGKKIPRPVRPEDTETRAAVDILQQSIVKNKRRIEEIKEEIDGKRAGRGKGSSEQQAVKNKLAELRGQFQQLLSQKTQLRAQLDVVSKSRESARASMKELRGSLKFTKVEDIDQHIAELEHRISHDSLSLNEEKKILEQIKTLRKSRSSIGELTSKVGKLEADSSTVDGLRDGIKGIDGAIDKIKAQEEVLRQELADMRAKEAERGSDIPGLIQERDECREICKAAYQKIQDLRAELDAAWATYKENNAIFRAQLQEDRARRQEEYLKQKAERDAEWKERIASEAPEPFDKEVTMCEQLASYLRKYVGVAEAAAEEEKKDLSGALQGFKPLQKPGIDQDDAWLLGGKGKGKGKSKAKKEEKKVERPEKLVHSLDILEAFSFLSLEVPTSKDRMPALLEEVAAKKEHFLAKRTEVKERPVGEQPAAEVAEKAVEKEGAEEASEDAPKKQAAKKGGKAVAPPQLDDDASWPSIGGAPAPAAADANGTEAEEDEATAEAEAAEAEAEAAAAEAEAAAAEGEAEAEEEAEEEASTAMEVEEEEEAAPAPAEEEAAATEEEPSDAAEERSAAAAAAAAGAVAAAVASASEEEAAAEEEEAAEPETEAEGKNGQVAVNLSVSDDGLVSLALSA